MHGDCELLVRCLWCTRHTCREMRDKLAKAATAADYKVGLPMGSWRRVKHGLPPSWSVTFVLPLYCPRTAQVYEKEQEVRRAVDSELNRWRAEHSVGAPSWPFSPHLSHG